MRHRVPNDGDGTLPEHAVHPRLYHVVPRNLRGQREVSVDEMADGGELLRDRPPVRIQKSDPCDPLQVTLAWCEAAARFHDAFYARAP
jgi:hypothetical protein